MSLTFSHLTFPNWSIGALPLHVTSKSVPSHPDVSSNLQKNVPQKLNSSRNDRLENDKMQLPPQREFLVLAPLPFVPLAS